MTRCLGPRTEGIAMMPRTVEQTTAAAPTPAVPTGPRLVRALGPLMATAVASELAGRAVLGYWGQRGLTVAVILGLALVNARGVKWGGGLQLLITLVKVGSLIFIIALPFLVLASPSLFPGSATPSTANL